MTTSAAGQSVITQMEAEKVLAPYLDRLNRCIQHGWDTWKQDYAHKHHVLGSRARAAIIFDEIVFKALEEFPQTDDVRAVRSSHSFMLYIGDQLTLRFKKIKKNGRCSNIRTHQQALFQAQVQMCFPTMLEGTLVHAGYTLDDLQQEIARKSVVCQLRNRVVWMIPLSGNQSALVVMPPVVPADDENNRPRFVVKPEFAKELPAAKASGTED